MSTSNCTNDPSLVVPEAVKTCLRLMVKTHSTMQIVASYWLDNLTYDTYSQEMNSIGETPMPVEEFNEHIAQFEEEVAFFNAEKGA
jgi:hypothetical protein